MIPKFRCFDKDTKTVHEVVAIDFKDWRVYYEAYGLRSYWKKNVVLMQSTGLHDKNGVEIFEGDIVSHFDGEFSYKGVVTQDGVTCWWIEGLEPDDNFSFGDVTDYTYHTCDLVVKGNIYDNTELLGE